MAFECVINVELWVVLTNYETLLILDNHFPKIDDNLLLDDFALIQSDLVECLVVFAKVSKLCLDVAIEGGYDEDAVFSGEFGVREGKEEDCLDGLLWVC